MKKESVNKFDLEAAFKALDEVEIPVVKGILPNRVNLQERFTKKLVTDVLVEDYFDVNDSTDLEAAQEEREAEIAKAKLARIEKIVDLDAESEEDLLPSYVGKYIIQCPQCMTLFYKNEADIEKSEENPEVVNINEACQHCGNTSGYTLIGKVDTVGEDEAENYDVEDFDENELNLDFDVEAEEEPAEEAPAEDVAEEETEEEAELTPVEDTEEEVKESLTESAEDFEETEEAPVEDSEEPSEESAVDVNGEGEGEADTVGDIVELLQEFDDDTKVEFELTQFDGKVSPVDYVENYLDDDVLVLNMQASEEAEDYSNDAELSTDSEAEETPVEAIEEEEEVKESLNEAIDKELDAKLKLHNDYIEYLKKMIEQEEEALSRTDNEFVKQSIQRRLDAYKSDLEEALPTALKNEVETDLPTPEEADLEATENKEEKPEAAKESLKEDHVSTLQRKLAKTEIITKELVKHPMFKKLGERTIQRLLIPYYTDVMGAESVSVDNIIDFFKEEGFGVFAFDSYSILDRGIFKTLLKNDIRATEALEVFAKKYDLFPEERDLGEDTLFEYLFDVVIDSVKTEPEAMQKTIDELVNIMVNLPDTVVAAESLTEDSDAGLDILLDSEEFKKPISDAEVENIINKYESVEEAIEPGIESEIAIKNIVNTWESLEDLHEESLNKLTTDYLTEVYSNVKSFETTACSVSDNKLVVEGTINFNSGKSKSTTFVYESKGDLDGKLILEGLNADFATEKAFVLSCKIDTANCLIAESLNYKYTINDTLVEGLSK